MKRKISARKLKHAAKILALGKNPPGTLKRLLFTGVFFFIIFRFLLVPARLQGTSMEPSYRDGSINFINTLAYRWREPRRGDVVGIRFAGRRVMLFKRIIGLPGETIAFRGGKLYVSGKVMDEHYITYDYGWDFPEAEVGREEYFVAGDNRRMPVEDHAMGRVHKSRITGKALF